MSLKYARVVFVAILSVRNRVGSATVCLLERERGRKRKRGEHYSKSQSQSAKQH
jgi:hypothetical protein